MSEITYKNVCGHLEILRRILQSVEEKKLRNEMKEIDRIISVFNDYGDTPIQMKEPQKNKSKKAGFQEIAEKLFRKEYTSINGIKLDYTNLDCTEKVVALIEGLSKTKIIKSTTLIDLKLLYCLLTGEAVEIKGKKEAVFDAIKANVRARKTGAAFGNHR
jgi:hypothetical protein